METVKGVDRYDYLKSLFDDMKAYSTEHRTVDLIAVDNECETHEQCLRMYLSNNDIPHFEGGLEYELTPEMFRQCLFDRFEFENRMMHEYGVANINSVEQLEGIYQEVNIDFWQAFGERYSPIYKKWLAVVGNTL